MEKLVIESRLCTFLSGSSVLLTTHRPYILTSANILLYSDKVEKSHSKNGKSVIPRNYQITYDTLESYKVGDYVESIESLMDGQSHMIDING